MKCVDFFCGAGGAAYGLMLAGFVHVLGVEYDPMACLSFMALFPHCPVTTKNMFLYSVREIMIRYGIDVDFAGLIWLSCPCQGFSEGGQKLGRNDIRNNLVQTVIDACLYAPGAWVVLENVEGIKTGESEEIYADLMKQLWETERQILEWRIPIAEFGYVQDRTRIFVVCCPLNWKGAIPKEPQPPKDVVHQYYDDILPIGCKVHDPDYAPLFDNELPMYEDVAPGGNWKSAPKGGVAHWYATNYYGLKESDKKVTFLRRTPRYGKKVPCQTASTHCGADYRADFIHPELNRHSSVGEVKALMDFEPWHPLAGDWANRHKQTGNAVMPIMSKMVGLAIMEAVKQPILSENKPVFSRAWNMPSANTFSICAIEKLVKRYLPASKISIDPFARNCTFATITNDLNPKTAAMYHMEASNFLAMLVDQETEADLVFLDPPYSARQVKEVYDGIGLPTLQYAVQRLGCWMREKDMVDRILRPGGIVLSFGWNSSGMGKKRNYKMLEMLTVCHGLSHNDTICVAEVKL